MDDMRERLIKLIQESVIGCARHWAEIIADSIIENGGILPPCKLGDTLWILYTFENTIESQEVIGISIQKNSYSILFENGTCFTAWGNDNKEYFGKRIFLTKEEAEQALKV